MKNRILTLIAMPLIAVAIVICGYFFIKGAEDKPEPIKTQAQTIKVKKEEQDREKEEDKTTIKKKEIIPKKQTSKKSTNKNNIKQKNIPKHKCDNCGDKVSKIYSTECDGNLCEECYNIIYVRHRIVCEFCGRETDDVDWHGDYKLCRSCYEDVLYSEEGDESLYHRYDNPDYYNDNSNMKNIDE